MAKDRSGLHCGLLRSQDVATSSPRKNRISSKNRSAWGDYSA
jgi:hypothetical protein